ncbi:MAG: Ig-like domain-containing protein, partial [Pseudomonadota bacterium]
VAQGVLSGLITGDGGVTWTATLTPTASIADTSNLITLDNTGVADAAGNTGTGTTDSNNYAIDTLRPTASIVVADTALALGETSLVTITFNEAVSGLALGDFTVAQGVLSGLITGDGGVTWTATLTPTASITDTSNLITLDNTGILDAAGNTGTGTTGSNNYAIDSLRPTAAIVVADTALAAGETSLVTITFNEAVSGLALDDFTVAQGVLSGLITGDGGVTWTATLTPTVSTTDTSNLITLNNTGVIDAAGNAGTGTTDSNNYAIDTLRPSATILVADTALAAGEISLVTITMSEAVANFDNADLSLANGTLSTAVTADGGITWTATFTPNVDITDTTNVVTFASTGVIDAAGNIGAGPIDSNNFAIDTLRPSATIVVADTALAEGETSLVTITFNEAVTGFTNADLSIANGTLSTVSSADGGITWTATFTPTTSINDTTNLITLTNSGMQDAAGNAGAGTTDSNNYAIDTLGPVVDIALSDYALAAGETATVTFTFSEAVSGFTNTDLTISNGTLSAVSSSDGGVTWTATFTPTIDLEDATNVIGINNTGYTDVAGNTGTGTTGSINFTIDTLRPTATILVAESALAIGQTSLVTITLSEAVANFDNADLSAVNGTLSTAVTSDGGITWTAVFTPDADISDTTNVVTFDSTGVIDGGGNTGAGTIDSNSYSIDTLRPTATIVVADAALAAGETSLVTITFNEVVSGFSNADLTIANGTLSAVSSSDGGLTWTATFTPTASITDTTNLISLDKTGIMDAVGNSGTGVTDSNNYSIDSLAPTASIVVADSAINSGETSLVTITFSEAVTGLTNADLTVANGTLSAPISADGGITWTATLTPNGNIVDSANLITLNNTGIQDLAGNSGAGTTDSNNFLIDTDIPFVVSLGLPENDAYVAGQNLDFTVNLSEAALVDTSGGTPRIAIVLETGGTIYASYLSGSGTSALSFRATVSSGQLDINGISLGSSIDMNGGSIRDTVGNNALAPLTSVVTTDILVDAVISTIASVNTPVGVQYNAGDVLSFTLNTSENVLVNTAGGTPGLGLDIGGVTAYASYVAGSGSNTLVFQYTVQAGDTDANGIGVTTLSHNGATLQDAAGNAMDLTLNSVGNTSGVILDTTAPLVTSVQLQGSPSSYAQAINFVISFNEAIEHLDISDLSLSTTGNASASISGLQQLNGNNWLVQVHGIKGAGDIRLDVKGTTDITDAASNPLANGFTAGASFTAQLLPAAQPVKPHTSIAPTNPVSPVSTLTIAPPIIVATTTFEVGGATNNVLTTVANISAHSMFAATSVPGFDVSPIGTDPIGSTYITSSNGRGHFDGTPGRNLRDSTTSPLLQRLSPVVATDHSGLSDLNTVILEPGVPLYIPLPSSMFNAADPDRQLSVEVRMKNGKPLVSWLQFDPVKGVLTGQAPNGFDEKLQLQIIVHDNKGKSSFGEMELHFDSKAGAIQNVPEKAIQPKGKPGAEVMGKPALTDQFARYGHSAKTLEADALLTALTQVSTLSTTRI